MQWFGFCSHLTLIPNTGWHLERSGPPPFPKHSTRVKLAKGFTTVGRINESRTGIPPSQMQQNMPAAARAPDSVTRSLKVSDQHRPRSTDPATPARFPRWRGGGPPASRPSQPNHSHKNTAKGKATRIPLNRVYRSTSLHSMRPKEANWQLTWAAGGPAWPPQPPGRPPGADGGGDAREKNGYCPHPGSLRGGAPGPCSPQKLLRLVRRISSDRPLELAQDKMVRAAVLHGSPPTVAASSRPDGGCWRLRQAPL